MACRFCGSDEKFDVIDLGYHPPSNAYLSKRDLNSHERKYPLRIFVCTQCWLMQTEDYLLPEEFFDSNYAYLSSTSQKWLDHANDYSNFVINERQLSEKNFVIEIASNDGYLLTNFVERNIPCLGIEPTRSSADIAKKKNVPTEVVFFDEYVAQNIQKRYGSADLIIANNVLAHVPDINTFTKGLKIALGAKGVITVEFPHVLNLLQYCQYDTIYHEHFSYLSFEVVKKIFKTHGLEIFRVQKLETHGGSLRIWATHFHNNYQIEASVSEVIREEHEAGLFALNTYRKFARTAADHKEKVIRFLLDCKDKNMRVAAYGAAAKGNTVLNYIGATSELIRYVVDASELKQGKFLPGSHIPIYEPKYLESDLPDALVILPWNIQKEILAIIISNFSDRVSCVTLFPEVKHLN